MKLSEEIAKKLLEFSAKVEKAILNHEFEKLDFDHYTIKIKCLDEIVEIWNANEEEHTYCRSVEVCGYKYYLPEQIFKNPCVCRKILRAETREDVLKRIKQEKEKVEHLESLLD